MCLYCRDVLPHAESIQHYLQDSYMADVAGHGIVKCVHVEAEWPGDPVEETKCVCLSVCLPVCPSVCLSVSQMHAKDWHTAVRPSHRESCAQPTVADGGRWHVYDDHPCAIFVKTLAVNHKDCSDDSATSGCLRQ